MKHTDFLLKVLKGTHADSLISLESRRLIVGGGDTCDIILSDLNAEDRCIEIVFRGEKIFIKGLDVPVFLDGEELLRPSIYESYKPYQLIDFGVCSISIGESKEGSWPSDNVINSAESLQKLSAEDRIETPSGFSFDNVINRKVLLGLGTISAVVITASVLLLGRLDEKTITSSSIYDSLPSKIRRALDEKGFDQIRISNTPAGRIKLAGIVLDADSKMAVEKLALPLTKKLTNNILIKEKIELNVKMILHSYGITNTKLFLSNNNVLSLSGYANGNWLGAKSSILEDIPAIIKIDDSHLDTSDKRLNQLHVKLAISGLDKKITINNDKGILTAFGEIVDSDLRIWKQVKEEYSANYSPSPTIRDKVTDVADKITLSIQCVSVGRSRYFISTAGNKYMVGSDLGNGYRVESIEVDKILLKNEKNNMIPIAYFNADEKPDDIQIFF